MVCKIAFNLSWNGVWLTNGSVICTARLYLLILFTWNGSGVIVCGAIDFLYLIYWEIDGNCIVVFYWFVVVTGWVARRNGQQFEILNLQLGTLDERPKLDLPFMELHICSHVQSIRKFHLRHHNLVRFGKLRAESVTTFLI